MALLKTLPSDDTPYDVHYHRIGSFSFSKPERIARFEMHSYASEEHKDLAEAEQNHAKYRQMCRSWTISGVAFDTLYAANTQDKELLFHLLYQYAQDNRSAEGQSTDADGNPVSDFSDAVADHKDVVV